MSAATVEPATADPHLLRRDHSARSHTTGRSSSQAVAAVLLAFTLVAYGRVPGRRTE
jgi:hypothetical protein